MVTFNPPDAAKSRRELKTAKRCNHKAAGVIRRLERELAAVRAELQIAEQRLRQSRKTEVELFAQLGRLQIANAPRPAAPPRPEPEMLGELARRIALPFDEHPELSVIVPTYGQVGMTLRCLASIADAPPNAAIEVIVAEDCSADPLVALLAEVQGLRLLHNPENLGFLRNCNAAAAHARGRYLLLLNNDTEVRPGAIDALLDTARDDPQVGMVGAKLVFPNGRLQEAGGIVWNDASAWNWGRGGDPQAPEFNYLRDADYCSGAAILLPSALFAELGGFDDAYAPAYYEDTDLAFRIRARGLRVLYQPKAEVLHHEGVSHGTDTTSGIKAHMVVNRERFLERWRDVLQRDHVPNATRLLRAADRAVHRPVILVVDHLTPEPDRDAGSRVIDHLLRTLVGADWLVKFRPANGAATAPYTGLLQQAGIEAITGPHAAFSRFLSSHGPELNHVVLSRPDVAAWHLDEIKRHAPQAALSYFGHDLHFARLRREAVLSGDETLLAAAAEMETKERRLWQSVDCSIYVSDEEAEEVRLLQPGAAAAAMSPYRFAEFPLRDRPPSGAKLLFVAGFAHPPNVDAAEWLVRDILPRLLAIAPEATLDLVGSHPSDRVKALAGPRVNVAGWVSDAELSDRYRQARAAVAPMRFGAGVKGKVAEALSLGAPLVTTPTGAQGLPGLAGVCTVSDDPAAIAAALAKLLRDDSAWLAQSQAQTGYAAEMFGSERLRSTLLAALRMAEQRHLTPA